MSLMLIQYFVHDAILNGSRLGGVQTVTLEKSFSESNHNLYSNPFKERALYYEIPNTSFSIEKILTDSYGPTFPGFDIRELIPKRPVDKYDLGVIIYGGGSIKFVDSVLTGIAYSFRNTGWFSERLSFEARVSEQTTAGNLGEGISRSNEGVPYQRQHFTGGSLPTEIAGQILLSVDIELSINHQDLISYGYMKTYETKFVSLPVDITASFTILDRGYSQSRVDYTGSDINDVINQQAISISTVPFSIDLGDKNVLVSMSRSGADAGNSDYSTITYTYKNINNYFKLL